MKNCPKCQRQLPDKAKFCGNCGRALEKPKPKEELKYCPQCGKEIIKGNKFCVGCGAQLPTTEQISPTLESTAETPLVPPSVYAKAEPKPLAKKYALYGIICGILGTLFLPLTFIIYFPLGLSCIAGLFLFGIPGIYSGLKARESDPSRGRGGIVLGSVDCGVGVGLLLFLLILSLLRL